MLKGFKDKRQQVGLLKKEIEKKVAKSYENGRHDGRIDILEEIDQYFEKYNNDPLSIHDYKTLKNHIFNKFNIKER